MHDKFCRASGAVVGGGVRMTEHENQNKDSADLATSTRRGNQAADIEKGGFIEEGFFCAFAFL